MLRKNPPDRASLDRKLTEAECSQLAELLVDQILDPSDSWKRDFLLGGRDNPGPLDELLRGIGYKPTQFGGLSGQKFAEAIEKRDRATLIAAYKAYIFANPPNVGQALAALQLNKPERWRSVLKGVGQAFKAKVGRKPKLPRGFYPELAAKSDQLFPVLKKLLSEQKTGTRRTTRELLKFWKKDCPEPCAFLLRHISRLELILKDAKLLQRATRPDSRARLIADAMAGADYKLAFRTSIERAQEARRLHSRPSV